MAIETRRDVELRIEKLDIPAAHLRRQFEVNVFGLMLLTPSQSALS